MLRELRIRNFAIIEELTLELAPGLVVFTGETGAGKSILVDAVALVLGGRADPVVIRQGADRAYIEATFTLTPETQRVLRPVLQAQALWDDEAPEELVLSREIRLQGRNPARVNGQWVNLRVVREIAAHLVDIHGQSEHLTLLQPRHQQALLDRYAHTEDLLADYQHVYSRWEARKKALEQLRVHLRTAARQMDLLQYQIQEIEAAHLVPGEEEDLRQERARLTYAERLARWAQETLQLLDEGTPELPPATDQIGRAITLLENMARLDSSQQVLAQQAQEVLETLSQICRDLRNYVHLLEFNPQRLEEVEARLHLIENLKRKYGDSIKAIIAYAEQARKELEELTTADERLAQWEVELEHLTQELARMAMALSEKRREAAERLAEAVEQELADLRMSHARFRVEVAIHPDPKGLPLPTGDRVAFDRSGIDQVTFLIAPNPGEGYHPLAKIASGGETSRIMLALRKVLAQEDPVSTLIFDEIDQGIGGRMGSVVGAKLQRLARHHQVLCVTHLPQLAAYAHQHFKVEKILKGGRTVARVHALSETDRVRELSQMLGDTGPAGQATARSLLERARSPS